MVTDVVDTGMSVFGVVLASVIFGIGLYAVMSNLSLAPLSLLFYDAGSLYTFGFSCMGIKRFTDWREKELATQ